MRPPERAVRGDEPADEELLPDAPAAPPADDVRASPRLAPPVALPTESGAAPIAAALVLQALLLPTAAVLMFIVGFALLGIGGGAPGSGRVIATIAPFLVLLVVEAALGALGLQSWVAWCRLRRPNPTVERIALGLLALGFPLTAGLASAPLAVSLLASRTAPAAEPPSAAVHRVARGAGLRALCVGTLRLIWLAVSWLRLTAGGKPRLAIPEDRFTLLALRGGPLHVLAGLGLAGVAVLRVGEGRLGAGSGGVLALLLLGYPRQPPTCPSAGRPWFR